MSEGGEKTFAPTARRKQDAAKKGDVFRSREVATAAAIGVGACWLLIAGPWLLSELGDAMTSGLSFDHDAIADFRPGALLLTALLAALPPVLSLALPILLLALATQLGMGDGRWVPTNLAFKGSRIDPVAGLKRMFGLSGWIELGKGLLKLALLGAIARWWAGHWLARVATLGGGNLTQQLAVGWTAITSLLLALSAGLVVIALIDMPVQWLRRNQRLKMSLQEVRDENKETEGSPEARAHRRQRQRDIAAGSVAQAMREAQFVLTNPTHFAVAMLYDPQRAAAPLVLAKGRGEKAQAMKELARELGVPMLEYPLLTRSVYFTTRESQTIREELFAAVAAVLAFVLSIKRGESRPLPVFEVPVALRFDADGRVAP